MMNSVFRLLHYPQDMYMKIPKKLKKKLDTPEPKRFGLEEPQLIQILVDFSELRNYEV